MDVTNNEAENQFETTIEGAKAVAAYQKRDGKLVLTHTNVPAELSGRGIAGHLAKRAFEHARENKLRIVPLCSYMAAWGEKHPEYADLIEIEK